MGMKSPAEVVGEIVGSTVAVVGVGQHCLKYLSLLEWYIPSIWNS